MFTTRPVVQGRNGMVTAGHYLGAAAGLRILQQGGNAIDAAAAMTFALNLLEPHNDGLGGEVPVLIYSAKEQKTFAVSGQGTAPRAMTIEWFQKNQTDLIPGDGLLPAMVPAVVGTWAEALARFGTLSFAQVLQPALEIAEQGYPTYPNLQALLTASAKHFLEHYPETARLYLPGGKVPENGHWFKNPDTAALFHRMRVAEEAAKFKGRVAGIEAARDEFYKGETAHRIADYVSSHAVMDATGRENKGFLAYEDLASWHARVEEPVSLRYRGLDVHKCPPWCQGPVFLQQLAILEEFDLNSLGQNSADYIHTWIETAKLAFADREVYYGDPDFDKVPLDQLLSKDYNRERMGLIGDAASMEFRPGGAWNKEAIRFPTDVKKDNEYARLHAHDTTHCDAIDRWGNMVAATPSGGWIQSSPVIPGLGFCLGTRGQMFYLNPKRANALQPGKRPRATLTPTLVTKNGKPYMVFGTQGGDQQDQWTLQFFLNVVEFGMDLQEAIDAPTVHTAHLPSSFYPRAAEAGKMYCEDRLSHEVRRELERRGHRVGVDDGWSHGRVLAIRRSEDGRLEGAASPRHQMAYAMGW